MRAILSAWPLSGWSIAALAATAVVYVRGWRSLRRAGALRIGRRELAAFLCGLVTIFVALESPIEPLASMLLTMHMVQHLLLMLVAAPLIVIGAPEVPLLVGMPVAIRRYWVLPVVRSAGVRAVGRWLTRPAVAWVISVVAVWLWHIPALYELALRDQRWHYVEHASFLLSAVLFWWVVFEPFPARRRIGNWFLVPYLFLAGVQGGLLAALLTFADRVVYPHYAAMPRLWGVSPLADQALAGAIMWVGGIVAYLVPLAWVGSKLLYGGGRRSSRVGRSTRTSIALPVLQGRESGSLDLLRVPALGRFLRWRFARPTMQVAMLLLSAAVMLDGFCGPQVAPLNLAGTLPWIHWRGLLVIGLLAVGNMFCMACPFTLPRTLARRWLPAGRAWPGWLRSKWPAVGLLLVFFVAYEACDLWARPWWTAAVALAFFVAAFLIDGVFRGGTFCKYVCPIGQFNFVQSMVSPFEVRARSASVCAECHTRECIRGGSEAPGCEMGLFLPHKGSNLDCTLCLDCIHACPHDNIGIVAAVPGRELWLDRLRSGLGRLSRRTDVAALSMLLVFAAFVNAAGMVAPVIEFEQQIAARLGIRHHAILVSVLYAAALVVAPSLIVLLVAFASERFSGTRDGWRGASTRYALAFVPLGFAMWLAHYGFHLATSAGAVIPAAGRFMTEFGPFRAGASDLVCNCCSRPADWLIRAEIIALDAGLLLSLYAAYQISGQRFSDFSRRARAVAPWAALMIMLFIAGIWILFQPMQMRGTTGVGA